MISSFSMAAAAPVHFGPGRVQEIAQFCAGLNTPRDRAGPILLVADAALEDLGIIDRIEAPLRAAGHPAARAAWVAGEPSMVLIDRLAEAAREARAVTVVAVGGGAALDAAKLAAAIAEDGRPALDFACAAAPLPEHDLPVIAVPTTAGTGSEVTRTAIASDPEGVKLWYWGEALLPRIALLDPELTRSLPPTLTAWTGMDAVAHALEAATSARATAPGIAFGLSALALLHRHLPTAVADGNDLIARGQVLWAATLAGRAIEECGTHMGHNVSHALGSLVRIHHGQATALALEALLPWLVEHADPSFAAAARALGGAEEAKALPDVYSALMRAVGIAPKMPRDLAPISSAALAAAMTTPANAPMMAASPRPLSPGDIPELASRVLALQERAEVLA